MNWTYIRKLSALGLIFLLLVQTGCHHLQPLSLPDENALAPAQAPLWDSLGEAQPDDWVALLNTGAEAIEWRLRLLDSATRSIDLQSFLWLDDAVGSAVLAHILKAADRGVKIRILLDDTFTAGHAREIWQIDHHENIEFRIYNPYTHRDHGMIGRTLFNLGEFSRVDHRMHNKALIVDNRAAILGGRNIGDEYFGWHPEANFRDLELVCVGEQVQSISRLFDTFWNNDWTYPESILEKEMPDAGKNKGSSTYETAEAVSLQLRPKPQSLESHWLDLLRRGHPVDYKIVADLPPPTNPAEKDEWPNQLAQAMMRIFDQAESDILIESAYLIPVPELEATLARAVDRDVRVRILTNSMSSNNHLAAHASYQKHIRTLIQAGVELYEVRILAADRERYIRQPIGNKHLALHAKFALIDHDLCLIGSANLDPRSLRLNTEMSLLIESEIKRARSKSPNRSWAGMLKPKLALRRKPAITQTMKNLLTLSLICCLFTPLASHTESEDSREFDPAFVHVVYFWFKNPDSLADHATFKDALRQFMADSKFAKTKSGLK